jgi:tRNA dimethylallyltransferase
VKSPADIAGALLRSRTVLALVGPTASGKTAVGVELARALGAEIISADSRQIYQHLDIGTAKPAPELLALVPHHFVDTMTPDREFSAGEFGLQGRDVVGDLFSRGRVPLVVGGAGLYVRSLLDGFFEGPGSDPDTRAALQKRLAERGMEDLLDQLRRVDPVTAGTIDPSKPRRVIRALEVYLLSGIPLSRLQSERRPRIDFSHVTYGLQWERQALYQNIERRCDEMLRAGLLEEVDRLATMGYDDRLNALNTVGYAEVFAFRRGEIDRAEMVRRMKQNSRNYAKRQVTWFKRDHSIRWVDGARGASDVAEEILRDLSVKGTQAACG